MPTKILFVYLSLLIMVFASQSSQIEQKPHWSATLKNSTDKRQSFIDLLLPLINEQNQKILKDRNFVKLFFDKYPQTQSDTKIPETEYTMLLDIAKRYRVSNVFDKNEYFEKIDTIPASLVLSQAALESGWGTSNVSKSFNNLFGQRVFSSSQTKSGKKLRYASFETIGDAVRSYMTNLNSHDAYREFRKKRADTRSKNMEFTGLKAAKTLINYSEVNGYTKMVSQMIKSYFSVYDEARSILAAGMTSNKDIQ